MYCRVCRTDVGRSTHRYIRLSNLYAATCGSLRPRLAAAAVCLEHGAQGSSLAFLVQSSTPVSPTPLRWTRTRRGHTALFFSPFLVEYGYPSYGTASLRRVSMPRTQCTSFLSATSSSPSARRDPQSHIRRARPACAWWLPWHSRLRVRVVPAFSRGVPESPMRRPNFAAHLAGGNVIDSLCFSRLRCRGNLALLHACIHAARIPERGGQYMP
jgi:hypothetical protein